MQSACSIVELSLDDTRNKWALARQAQARRWHPTNGRNACARAAVGGSATQ